MITYYSTNKKIEKVSLKEAVLSGLAPDGGLYMPDRIPQLESRFFKEISNFSFNEIAFAAGKNFLSDIPETDLRRLIEDSFPFTAPVKQLKKDLFVLELFHGPTLSFKDFGARFMARLIGYYRKNEERELNILTATSGDTGSAVGSGFRDIPGINVWILYPKGQVSNIQEQQMTTFGHNVKALEVKGTFDDCQALVKMAFNDSALRKQVQLSSANSINIARLIPQSFYYLYAYGQVKESNCPLIFSVPSGNFGNLTAGLLAKKMGLPVEKFIASTNINNIFPSYLETGIFTPKPSQSTLSNAMDVGNPSNFSRILDLYGYDVGKIRQDIAGFSFTDEETKMAIKELNQNFGYLSDPHGAVGYLGLKKYGGKGIYLATAHPAKFVDIVEPLLEKKIDLPDSLKQAMTMKKMTIPMENSYSSLKSLLMR